MTFPGAYSEIHYNSDGEPTGWDNTAYFEPPEPDPGDFDPACFDAPWLDDTDDDGERSEVG